MSGPIVVTGGRGFIGSAFVRRALARGVHVTNVDAGTYAADPRRLPAAHDLLGDHTLDVTDERLAEVVEGAEAIVHFAAETHVTRGETAEEIFFRTNVEGTRAVLDAAALTGVELVVHVSTDEVYGPASSEPFAEEDKEPGEGRATSAYARSKALADDLALGFDGGPRVVVVRPTNCFGPWQHPEKAIPRWIARALSGGRLPVWGDGGYVRDWMFVDDACEAIELLLEQRPGPGAYNVGPQGDAVTNLAIARAIARLAGRGDDAVYLTEYDRPRHDRRYSVDASKLRGLGWGPLVATAEALYDDESAAR